MQQNCPIVTKDHARFWQSAASFLRPLTARHMPAFRRWLTVSVLSVALCLCLSAPARAACERGEEVIKLMFNPSISSRRLYGIIYNLADYIDTELDGRACVRILQNGIWSDETQQIERMLVGEFEMMIPTLQTLSLYTLDLDTLLLPYRFDVLSAAVDLFSSTEGSRFLEPLKVSGIIGLGYLVEGFNQISANVPFTLPEELESMNILAGPGYIDEELISALGARRERGSYDRYFNLLQNGYADGLSATWFEYNSEDIYKLQDGITKTDHQISVFVPIVSQRWLQGLQPGLRTDLRGLMDDFTRSHNYDTVASNKIAMDLLIDKGVEVRRLNNEERRQWRSVLWRVGQSLRMEQQPNGFVEDRSADDGEEEG